MSDAFVQVLSETVSKGISKIVGEEGSETAKFVLMMDKFFDTLNVHNYDHGIHQNKKFQFPFKSAKDKRLTVRDKHNMYFTSPMRL